MTNQATIKRLAKPKGVDSSVILKKRTIDLSVETEEPPEFTAVRAGTKKIIPNSPTPAELQAALDAIEPIRGPDRDDDAVFRAFWEAIA